MKKTLQRLGMVTVGLSLCLWSCKEQDGLVKPEDATSAVKVAPKIKEKIDFSVVDGRLKFETMEDFKGAVAKMGTLEGIKEMEQKGGFTSMNEAYKAFCSENVEGSKNSERVISREYDDIVVVTKDNLGKKNFKMALPVPGLAALVNKDAIVQIAGKVMKFSDEAVKIADVQYKNELELNTPSSHVTINKVNKHLGDGKANKSGKVLANWDNDTYISYPVWGGFAARRWRVREMFHDYNIGYAPNYAFTYLYFCGVEVENQRDDWNGWSSCWLDGWEWGAGNAAVSEIYDPATGQKISKTKNLGNVWPTSWGPSNGIQEHNTERIFRGTAGFFETTVGWGEYAITASGTSTNMASHSFGRAEIRDPNNPNNSTNHIFDFFTLR
ncbi:MAG: hypothetical protein U5N85_19330 [Arcicella sp.]|nr:hypothetical protein [Arcicella sp.]